MLYNLHFLFCCNLSILTLIRLVLMALFCVAIIRDSVSLTFLATSTIYRMIYRLLVVIFPNKFLLLLRTKAILQMAMFCVHIGWN